MLRRKPQSNRVCNLSRTLNGYRNSIEAFRKSGGRLTEYAIAEMHDYLRRIGYKVRRVLPRHGVHAE